MIHFDCGQPVVAVETTDHDKQPSVWNHRDTRSWNSHGRHASPLVAVSAEKFHRKKAFLASKATSDVDALLQTANAWKSYLQDNIKDQLFHLLHPDNALELWQINCALPDLNLPRGGSRGDGPPITDWCALLKTCEECFADSDLPQCFLLHPFQLKLVHAPEPASPSKGCVMDPQTLIYPTESSQCSMIWAEASTSNAPAKNHATNWPSIKQNKTNFCFSKPASLRRSNMSGSLTQTLRQGSNFSADLSRESPAVPSNPPTA